MSPSLPQPTFDELLKAVRNAQEAVSAKQADFLLAIERGEPIETIDVMKRDLDAFVEVSNVAVRELMAHTLARGAS